MMTETYGIVVNGKAMKVLRKVFGLLACAIVLGAGSAAAVEKVVYFHNDALGSPVAATNAQGQVLWTEAYDPYGARVVKSASAQANSLWYTGKQEETELGLNYFGARWYESGIGRFHGIDPAELKPTDVKSFNRYAYANDNPFTYIDPDGRDGKKANEWARAQVGKSGYGYWNANPEARGRIRPLLGGAPSEKCNKFAWDVLKSGGDPAGRMADGRIPSASEWGDQSVQIPGYTVLPGGAPLESGDIVSDGSHVGIYSPLADGKPGTVSAAMPFNGGAGPNGGVVHNDWGFRPGQKLTAARRCNCDINKSP